MCGRYVLCALSCILIPKVKGDGARISYVQILISIYVYVYIYKLAGEDIEPNVSILKPLAMSYLPWLSNSKIREIVRDQKEEYRYMYRYSASMKAARKERSYELLGKKNISSDSSALERGTWQK
jgi:hypothetical protein